LGEDLKVQSVKITLIEVQSFLLDQSSVDFNWLFIIFRVGVKYCNGFEELLSITRTEMNPEWKNRAITALGFAPLERVDEVLQIGLSSEFQDIANYLVGVGLNRESDRKLWDFIQTNWDVIENIFRTVAFTLPNLIRCGISRLNCEGDAIEIE
jgi:hypothetical protein